MKYCDHESAIVELKKTLPTHDQIVKTIIGFCNRNGGKLVVGVEDSGNIVGVDEGKVQEWLEYLDKLIYESSAPPIMPLVYPQRIGDKVVLIIEVSSGTNKPYYLKREGLEKGTYIRLGRSTLRADADMIEELKWLSRGQSFDTMPIYHAKEEEIDTQRVHEFLKQKRGYARSAITKERLLAYHLVSEEHTKCYPTVAGLLLFGSRPQHYLPEAFIICSHFSGTSGRKVVATRDCMGTLFQQLEDAFDFVVSRLNRSFVINAKKRKEELEIPAIAIRELLINAIVHRNYHIQAPIKIALYDDRLEIFSPGTFPGPITPQNILTGLTYIRNRAICKVFREAGYMEKLGSGFLAAFRAYEERGLKEPQVIEGENFVKCLLPRGAAAVLRDGEDGQERRIVALLDVAESITISDVVAALGIPRATAGRKLAELVQRKVLQRVGRGKSVCYQK